MTTATQQPGVTRTTVSLPLPDVAVTIDEAGAGESAPVVWVHGELGHLEDAGSRPLGPRVTSSSRTLMVHLPGFGVSRGVERFDRLDDLAMALWWTLDHCGVDGGAVLAGHGLGAAVVAEMAVQQPSRLHGLLLAAPFGMFRADEPGIDLFGSMPADLMPALYADPTGDVAARHFPKPVDAHDRGLAAIRRVETLGASSRFIFPIPDTGIAARLYRVADVPTTLVFGRRDGLVPVSLAEDWRAALPHASVVIVDGAAHMVPYESDEVELQLANLAVGRSTTGNH
jgi:pimeloyl-ACP methyl ester carboxylesterase